jgi:hypothetical protein
MSELKFRKPNYEKGRRECAERKEVIDSFRKFIEESGKVSYETMNRHMDI